MSQALEDSSPNYAQTTRRLWSSVIEARVLVAITLLVGLGLRILGIEFGLPLQLHPDEWSQALTAQQMHLGDLNPHFFRYPTFFIYQLFAVDQAANLFSKIAGISITTADFFLLGRLLSAVYGVFLVMAIYLLGSITMNRIVGLMAAVLLALSPAMIEHSHYATVDVAATFWAVLALVFAVRAAQRSNASFLITGIAAGLAVGTKYTAALIVPMLTGLIVWDMWRKRLPGWKALDGPKIACGLIAIGAAVLIGSWLMPESYILDMARRWTTDGRIEDEYLNLFNTLLLSARVFGVALTLVGATALRTARVRQVVLRLLHPQVILFLASVVITFLISSPFVLIDFPHAARDIFYEYRHGLIGAAAHFQVNDPIYSLLLPKSPFPDPSYYFLWWFSQNGLIVLGFLPLGALILAKDKQTRHVLVTTFGIALLSLVTLTHAANKADRYALILIPLTAFWTSAGIWWIWTLLYPKHNQIVLFFIFAATAVFPAITSAKLLRTKFLLPDTRVLAWHWVNENVKPGEMIVREYETPDLEHVDPRFKVIRVTSAFENRTLADWQHEHARYILVGSQRQWYSQNARLYPNVAASYAHLDEQTQLVADFQPKAGYAAGPSIWIYKLTE